MRTSSLIKDFDVNVYNALPSVEEADNGVRAGSELDGFLGKASKLFRSHKVQFRFGVALLHNHCQVSPGEWMVETDEEVDGARALVTQPVGEGEKSTAVPTVWQLQNGDFVPLEYSADPLVGDLLFEDDIPDQFVADFKELIRGSSIGKHLGLSVVFRNFYKQAQDGEIPVEFTKPGRRNVVFFRPSDAVAGKVIETTWSFDDLRAESGCGSTCRRQCYSKEGGHDKDHSVHHFPQS
jgi:hypothetical protein